LGCPRSGTTLLRDILHDHPHLAFPTESHFVPVFYKAYGDPANEAEALRLADRILRLYWVRLWDLDLKPADFAHFRLYRQIISHIYETYARKQNKIRWGDKTPQYVTQIPTLHAIFPEGKIIHIYRDGRDVVLSWLTLKSGPRNLFTIAETWKDSVGKGRRDGAALPPGSYLEVRYETLVAHPDETVQRICDFIGEPFDPTIFSRSVLRRNQRRPWFGRRDFGILDTQIVRENVHKWKGRMSTRQQVLFESVAGNELKELGYETGGVIRHISLPERLFWRLHFYFGWVVDRINTRDLFQWTANFGSMTAAHYQRFRRQRGARKKSKSQE
jgi:hypothetical protein